MEILDKVMQIGDVKHTRERERERETARLSSEKDKHWQLNIGYGLELVHVETTSL